MAFNPPTYGLGGGNAASSPYGGGQGYGQSPNSYSQSTSFAAQSPGGAYGNGAYGGGASAYGGSVYGGTQMGGQSQSPMVTGSVYGNYHDQDPQQQRPGSALAHSGLMSPADQRRQRGARGTPKRGAARGPAVANPPTRGLRGADSGLGNQQQPAYAPPPGADHDFRSTTRPEVGLNTPFGPSHQNGTSNPADAEEKRRDRARCVTVFGFPPEASSYILSKFEHYGTIEKKDVPVGGNWIHLMYTDEYGASKALGKHQTRFDDLHGGIKTIMVAVIPCEEPQPGERAFWEEQENQPMSTISRSYATPKTKILGVGHDVRPDTRGTPRQLSTKSGHGAQRLAGARGLPVASTPQKESHVFSQLGEYLFG